MSVFFNGRKITTPTTASKVNDDAMRNQNLSVGNVVAYIGRSAAGKPKTALRFGSPDEAKAELVSGELLDAVLAGFSPSTETGGPTTVIAIRVQPATQATGTMKDGSNADVITLTSKVYGQPANLIGYKVEAGTVSGLRVTTQSGRNYYSQDNVGRKALTVSYSGAQASATIDVNGTQMVLSAPAGTAVATILFSDYKTVQDLVDRINLVSGFSAVVEGSSYTSPTLNGLDFVTAQSVKSAPYTVTADLQAVIDWLNSSASPLVSGTRVAGAGTKPAVAALKFLSGGSDGTTNMTDWADCFTALQSEDVQWITPVSSDPAIHAMLSAHCDFMSNVGQKERRGIVGTALNTSDADAITAAKAINSDRVSLVHIGHYNYDLSGNLTLFAPYITAALTAGMFSGVNPGTALTNKSINVRGLERKLRVPTDTDVLLDGGVMPIIETDEGYKVCQSITTWLVNDNYNRVEQSCGWALDYTMRSVRKSVDRYRGQKGNPLLLSLVASAAESTLKELAREEPQGPGILVGSKDAPAYRNITASIDGDVVRVQFECSPVIPANYILVTAFAVPFSGTVTA